MSQQSQSPTGQRRPRGNDVWSGGAPPNYGSPAQPRQTVIYDTQPNQQGAGKAPIAWGAADVNNEYQKRLQQAMMASMGQFGGQGGAPMQTATYQRGTPGMATAYGQAMNNIGR